MGLKMGVVGLPNVGKSTIFNALTKAGAAVANYPFCTIDPNIGVVPVPDARLDKLAEIHKPKKVTPTIIEFVDIAGLVKGASQGEGLGNQFLGNIKEVDAILHVVRCFKDDNVIHVSGAVDPIRDIEIIDTELCIKDLDTVTTRVQKLQKNLKSGDKDAKAILVTLERAQQMLEAGKPIRQNEWTEEDKAVLRELQLLTQKSVLYCANISEAELLRDRSKNQDLSLNNFVEQVEQHAQKEGARVVVICGKVEAEVAELPEHDAKLYLKEYGLEEPGLNLLIRTGYELLGLITFLTAGEPEVRAWTIHKGTKAPQAAGVIHTDFERGFIRAEIMSYDDLMKYGSQAAVKEKGLYRLEGKDYVMQDGDIVYFRFNV